MKFITIGLTGPMGSGKSTIAKMLSDMIYEEEGIASSIIPFGRALKKMAKDLGWDGMKNEKGRKILQLLGTDICRTINPDFWVKKWAEEVKAEFEFADVCRVDTAVIIADDIRFQNEFDACDHVFKIVGPVNEALERGIPCHESELMEFAAQPLSVGINGFGDDFLKHGAEFIYKNVFGSAPENPSNPPAEKENYYDSRMIENQKKINKKLEECHLEMNLNAIKFFKEILFPLLKNRNLVDCDDCSLRDVEICESFYDGVSDKAFRQLCPAVRFMEIYNKMVKI